MSDSPRQDTGEITLLLGRLREGDTAAFEELVAAIYEDCRRRAHQALRNERPGHTLQTIDLVHEGLLRMWRSDEASKAADRGQLFCAYSRALRQVLIDHARARDAACRGGGEYARVPLDELIERVEHKSGSTIKDLNRELGEMAGEFPEEAKVIEMHWFGGHSLEEIAAVLKVSLTTVERRHRFGKRELRRRLGAA